MKMKDIITTESLESIISSQKLIEKAFYFEETDSTNERAKNLYSKYDYLNMLFLADFQSKGKGRLGRLWEMPKGKDLMFSLCLKPNILPSEMQKFTPVTLVAAVCIVESLKDIGIDAKIKWPNDIVVGTRKLAGILTEMSVSMKKVNYVIIGIGINCNSTEFSRELGEKAISLYQITGKEVSRIELLKKLIMNFEILYNEFISNELANILPKLRSESALLGREIYIEKQGKTVKCLAKDINEKGELLVCHKDGSTEEILSGEINIKGMYGY